MLNRLRVALLFFVLLTQHFPVAKANNNAKKAKKPSLRGVRKLQTGNNVVQNYLVTSVNSGATITVCKPGQNCSTTSAATQATQAAQPQTVQTNTGNTGTNVVQNYPVTSVNNGATISVCKPGQNCSNNASSAATQAAQPQTVQANTGNTGNNVVQNYLVTGSNNGATITVCKPGQSCRNNSPAATQVAQPQTVQANTGSTGNKGGKNKGNRGGNNGSVTGGVVVSAQEANTGEVMIPAGFTCPSGSTALYFPAFEGTEARWECRSINTQVRNTDGDLFN